MHTAEVYGEPTVDEYPDVIITAEFQRFTTMILEEVAHLTSEVVIAPRAHSARIATAARIGKLRTAFARPQAAER